MTYDAASNTTGISYFDGTILTQVYDPLNRMTTMSDWGGITTYTFDSRSMLTGKTDPGGLVQAYVYADGLKRYEILPTGTTTLVWDGTDYLQGRLSLCIERCGRK